MDQITRDSNKNYAVQKGDGPQSNRSFLVKTWTLSTRDTIKIIMQSKDGGPPPPVESFKVVKINKRVICKVNMQFS